MGLLDGSIAAITGAEGSVARGIATRFEIEGATVFRIAPGEGVDFAHEIDAIVTKAGGLDIPVNAGQAKTTPASLSNKPFADVEATLSVGPLAAVQAMKGAYPHMLKRGGGRVINVGSYYGAMASVGLADAAASDGALAGLTRAVDVEWAAENDIVNYLQSGAVDGPEFDAYLGSNGWGVDRRIANLAILRLADPVEDVGRAAVFLASDEGCWLVGHKVIADGGQHLVAPVQDYALSVSAA
jgi:NAD(P)-dependent dehydrogenase (short-subunit alcohol dehydrogenase family)